MSQEICDNGIDDDGNGLIDLNDTACDCTGFGSSQTISSLIPNSSFETNTCCPSNHSQLNCADTWIQASGPTSDYYNTCGYTQIGAQTVPSPLPDGDGYVGFYNGNSFDPQYKEYIGSCLLSTMTAGTSYTINFFVGGAGTNKPINVTIFGSDDCNNLPFTSNCPTNPVNTGTWVELGNVLEDPDASGAWINTSITFTPTMDINAFVIGPDCNDDPGLNYYYVDGLTLAETSGFGTVTITESGGACSNDLTLNATADTSGTWQWYLDGVAIIGETSSSIDISGNNYGTGTYTARLTNGNKCETGDYIISVPSTPNAAFYTSNVCEGEPVMFTDTSNDSTGTITNWQWDFNNDGIIDDTSQNPSFTYPIAGTFTATLIATNSAGCNDTTTSNPSYDPNDSLDVLTSAPLVIVSPKPTANFTFDTVCLGNPTNFLDSSYGANISMWEWIIDGSTNANQNPSYQYTTMGPHTVSLKVTSDSGCMDSITKNVVLQAAPLASFSFTGVCENDLFLFTNETTIGGNPATSSISYAWDFGDMTTSTDENPTKAYTSGTYNVQLSVNTPSGCFDDTIIPLSVAPSPVASFSNTEVCFGESTTLTDQSTPPNGGSIINYQWSLDETNFNSQNVIHTFSNSGNNIVTLIVTTADGCTDTASNITIVHPLPIANFDFNPKDIDFFDTRVCFDNLSIDGSIYQWDFDFQGGQSVQQDPCINFPQLLEGEYDVQLWVSSIHGCLDSITRTVIIEEGLTVYVPNTFTPDGDGTNDLFQPSYKGVIEAELFIFNRWGQLIYSSDRLDAAWDGSHQGVAAKEDTYVWRIVIRDLFRTKHIYNGHVNLLR